MSNRHYRDNDEEYDSFGLPDPFHTSGSVEGSIDIERDQLGIIGWSTIGQCKVLIECLESVGYGQECAHRDAGHHKGQNHAPQCLTLTGTIHLRSFDDIPRQSLQPGDINNHHVADLLPAGKYHQAPESIRRREGDRPVPERQHAIEQQLPDVSQNDTANQIRHKEDAAEQCRPTDFLSQHIGDHEPDNIDDDGSYHCK